MRRSPTRSNPWRMLRIAGDPLHTPGLSPARVRHRSALAAVWSSSSVLGMATNSGWKKKKGRENKSPALRHKPYGAGFVFHCESFPPTDINLRKRERFAEAFDFFVSDQSLLFSFALQRGSGEKAAAPGARLAASSLGWVRASKTQLRAAPGASPGCALGCADGPGFI